MEKKSFKVCVTHLLLPWLTLVTRVSAFIASLCDCNTGCTISVVTLIRTEKKRVWFFFSAAHWCDLIWTRAEQSRAQHRFKVFVQTGSEPSCCGGKQQAGVEFWAFLLLMELNYNPWISWLIFFLSTPLKSGIPSISPHLWCQHTALTDISGRLWRTNVHSYSGTSVRSGTEKNKNMSGIDFNTICVFIHFMPLCECSNCNYSSSYVH